MRGADLTQAAKSGDVDWRLSPEELRGIKPQPLEPQEAAGLEGAARNGSMTCMQQRKLSTSQCADGRLTSRHGMHQGDNDINPCSFLISDERPVQEERAAATQGSWIRRCGRRSRAEHAQRPR